MFKALLLFAAVTVSSAALARVPVHRLETNSAFTQAREAFEEMTGQALTASQQADLLALVEQDRGQNLHLANNQGSRAIYCVGYNVAAVGTMSEAGCIELWTWKRYHVAAFGGGYALNFSLQVFRLVFTWDSTRYASTFDVIPGQYGLITQGGALLAGGTRFVGDAGNKSISGLGLNLGLGIDLFSGLFLIIR